MHITYKSDRIRIWQDGNAYYSAYKVRRFFIFRLWESCLAGYATEDQAAAHASHMWFMENFIKNKNIGRVDVRDGNKYVAQKRFLHFFWKDISGRLHASHQKALHEVNMYFCRTIADDIGHKALPEQYR